MPTALDIQFVPSEKTDFKSVSNFSTLQQLDEVTRTESLFEQTNLISFHPLKDVLAPEHRV